MESSRPLNSIPLDSKSSLLDYPAADQTSVHNFRAFECAVARRTAAKTMEADTCAEIDIAPV